MVLQYNALLHMQYHCMGGHILMYLFFGRSSVGLKAVQLHKGVYLVSVSFCYCLAIPKQIEEVNPPTGPQTVA